MTGPIFCFLLLLLLMNSANALIKLGLIESDPMLVATCQRALDEAKLAGKCTSEEIQ
jgi:hypothetical protein